MQKINRTTIGANAPQSLCGFAPKSCLLYKIDRTIVIRALFFISDVHYKNAL